MNTNSHPEQTTEVEHWDWRDTVWNRLTDFRRTKSFRFGIGESLSLLNNLTMAKWPKIDIGQNGETKLYRIDTLEHLLHAILQKRLYLSSPSSWEDPWEDPIGRKLEKEVRTDNMMFDCFALCFSTVPSCEALWRRMKDKGRSVRIETTIERLLSSIRIPICDDIANIDEQVFFDSVHYLDELQEKQFWREVQDLLAENSENDKKDIARVSSLFAKRKAFEYENEFRFVFRPKRQLGQPVRNYYELDLFPKRLISSLQIDPWCGDCEFEMISGYFKRLGFDCSRSDLATSMI